MPKVHDRGGWPNDDPIDPDEHEMEEWERQVDALNGVPKKVILQKKMMPSNSPNDTASNVTLP